MAAVRHLEFSKVGNFNFRSDSEAQCASPYQISRRSVKPFRRYGRFSIFQDGGRRHLGFWKFQNFNSCDAQESRTASDCQILSKSLKPRLRYGDFSIFQVGGRSPSWIFKSWKFQLPVPFGGSICIIVPNFAKIGQTFPEIWPIFDFSRWRPPPSWILENSFFNGCYAQEGRTASACQILSKSLKTRLRYGDFSIF